jgi:hypothetical protein
MGPLTTISRTGGTAPDCRVHPGQLVDLDLRIWMQADWEDVMHWSMDQKVGGSSPSERATRIRRSDP